MFLFGLGPTRQQINNGIPWTDPTSSKGLRIIHAFYLIVFAMIFAFGMDIWYPLLKILWTGQMPDKFSDLA